MTRRLKRCGMRARFSVGATTELSSRRRRQRDVTKRLASFLLCLILASCMSSQVDSIDPTKGPSATIVEPPGPSASGLNRLTFEVEIEEDAITPGAKTSLRVTVRNESNKTITDPGCYLGQTSAAIIPVGKTDAELWLQVIVDCSGPFKMKPGYEDTRSVLLIARTKYGEPLNPGQYIAALEIRGVHQRFEIPIEVAE